MNGKRRLILLALVFSLCLVSSSHAQLTKLSAAYSAESSWSLATWVAYDGGLFKKYGLDVDLVLIRSAATITAALLAGEAFDDTTRWERDDSSSVTRRRLRECFDARADNPSELGGNSEY